MQSKLRFLISFIFLIPILLTAQSIEITTPDSTTLTVGDSLELTAIYTDTAGMVGDTTLFWSVQPDSLGSIDNNYFMAEKAGSGFIICSLDTLLDSIYVMILPEQSIPDMHLGIVPHDTTIQVGNPVQFTAFLNDTADVSQESDLRWSVHHDRVGPISNTGLLFAYFPGQAHIKANLDTLTANTGLTVIDTTSDSTGINTIEVVRVLSNGISLPPRDVFEGDSFVIGGMPHPGNIINGGMVYFPLGSLQEDIRLEIKLPKLMKMKKDSVKFPNRIVNGIQFDVFVEDTLIEPYYFGKPLSVSIPFKRGIIKQLGVSAEDLGMFFAEDSITFDSLGIENVMVDSMQNRIYGQVSHFSTVVVREATGVTSLEPEKQNQSVIRFFDLKQNYPNPFNPSTTIAYQVSKTGEVELSIYNTLGQKVGTLVNGIRETGKYRVIWDARGMASGIYFYQLKMGNAVQTRKMLLMR